MLLDWYDWMKLEDVRASLFVAREEAGAGVKEAWGEGPSMGQIHAGERACLLLLACPSLIHQPHRSRYTPKYTTFRAS